MGALAFSRHYCRRRVSGVLQDVEHGNEVRFVPADNNTGVGGNGEFAVGESVKRVDRDVRADAGGEFDQDLYFGSRVVLHFLNPDFSFVDGL